MLGIIIALESETPNLSNYFEKVKKVNINGFSCYLTEVLKRNVVIIYSGVGKANAAAAAIALINNFSVNSIINIGSAGSVNTKLTPGSFFIPSNAQYIDVDATGFGYKVNQVPHENESFSISNKLSLILNEIINEYQSVFTNGNIGTSDSFVNQKNVNSFQLQKVLATDMESASIAQICSKNKIDFACVKYISDCIYSDGESEKQWKKNINPDNKLMSEIIYNVCCKYIYSFELNK